MKLLPGFRRARIEGDMDEELRAHIQSRADDLERSGLPRVEAERRARVEFGGYQKFKEECREALGAHFLETLLQDLRFALRMLRKSPGFTAVAVLTLALGIGANTAIFSMVNGIILRTLSYRQPQQLYVVNENVPQLTSQSPWGPWFPVNPANFLLWQGHCPAISSMALIEAVTFNLTGQGIPRQVNAARISANFFSLMGIRPQLGRTFLPQEDQLGRDHEVILTAQFWREVFNANPGIIGKSIILDNSSYIVVGVAPESFRFPEISHLGTDTPEIFKPIGFRPWESWAGLGGFNFDVIARLKPGASPSQALAQIDVVEARIAQNGDAHRGIAPGQFDLKATLRPLKTAILGQAQSALWMLMIAAGFVLLIICVNLANLMLVRNIARTHEVAVRSALGASRQRLLRQFFVEGLILAACGGLAGLLFARVALQALVGNAPFSIPRVGEIQIDPRVLLFAVGVTFATSVLFALLPTSRLSKTSPLEALTSSGRIAGGGPQSVRLRSGLVVSQIALCGVLLAGALLLIASLAHVQRANQWMDEKHVLALDITIPPNESNSVQHAGEFLSNILARVRALPGVQSAGFTSKLPLQGTSFGDDIDFREAPESRDKPRLGQFRFVSPGYFQAIGLPLIKGRSLLESDHGKDVALISETVAEKFLPGRDPIGMHLLWAGDGAPKPREIIGVVGDVRNTSDQLPVTAVYLPSWTYYQSGEALVVRTAMEPSAAAASIRRAIWNVDPEVAIPRERTLETVVSTSEAARRYESFLAGIFAGFAVLLAALGLYGVLSYSVGQRTHEIGIRVALGAQRGDVMRLVVGQGTKLALFGAGIGILAALGLTRLMAGLLFGISATDPLTFAAVAIVLVSVALVACYIPARRAMRVDPMVALRYE
ncbi:MAG TPA: ABC transporter permease [Candidatus Acidoferrales bacterium]|nr:ABC transporter permease [Candidatus Acidoferrales bacterium]